MKKLSDDWEEVRRRVLGLGETSFRKTHYPSLKQRVAELERLQSKLQQSEAYLAHAQKLTKVGSWAYKGPDVCEYWSAEMFRIFGLDPSNGYPPSGKFLSLVVPEDRQRVEEAFTEHFRDGRVYDLKYRILRPDGQIRIIRDCGTAVFENGVVTHSVGACLDITEQEQITEELRRREAYLAEAQKLSHTGSFGWKVGSNEIIWSDETFRIFEYGPTVKPTVDLIYQRVHPEDAALVKQTIERASQDGKDFEHEHRLLMPDGSVKYLHVVAHAISDASGSLEFVGALRDVTAAKMAEEKIRHAERELRITIETIPAAVWSALPDGSLEFVSKRWGEYTGVSEEEWKDWGWDGWKTAIHPDDVDRLSTKWQAVLATGESFEEEYRYRTGNGEYRWYQARGVALRDDTGKILRWYGTLFDIQDRKQAEQKLQQSEQQWRDVFENNPTMYFMVDAVGIVLAVNPFGAEQLGYKIDELVGQPVLRVLYEADRQAAQNHVEQCLKQFGQSTSWELRKIRKDGSRLWVRETARAVLREGQPVVLIACEDITERKLAEEKIREQEAELRQMIDLTPQHVHVLTAEASLIYTNAMALAFHGDALEDWSGLPLSQWQIDQLPITLFHPDDRERMLNELTISMSSGSQHQTEARLQRNDGEYIWFLFRYNPLRDEQGRVLRWYVAGTDIEERKQAEERLRNENVALREEIDKASMFEEIVGTSSALKAVLSRVAKVASADSTVLITGETGTGKELIARAVHKRSQRSSRPFVGVNLAAIPRDLIASELFGHEKGAFTGAVQRRLGRFELAEGGTIFLDEVGELPAETQIGLLRVLQEHEFERVGGTGSIQADVRVIAATNRDLHAAIAAGTFRNDLFYRLNVFPIEILPLRERREDIPLLVDYFIDRYARRYGKTIRGVSKKALDILQSYPWPGNIRELQNVIERSVILCETEYFSVDESWLPRQPLATEPKRPLDLSESLAAQEKELIEAALRATGGRVFGPSGAAAKLGIPRSTLESKIRLLKINKNRFKT